VTLKKKKRSSPGALSRRKKRTQTSPLLLFEEIASISPVPLLIRSSTERTERARTVLKIDSFFLHHHHIILFFYLFSFSCLINLDREGYVCVHSGERLGDRVKRLMVLSAYKGKTIWQEKRRRRWTNSFAFVDAFRFIIVRQHTHNSGIDTYTSSCICTFYMYVNLIVAALHKVFFL
jgi:hypothetical protein